jgi:hypothetical protein
MALTTRLPPFLWMPQLCQPEIHFFLPCFLNHHFGHEMANRRFDSGQLAWLEGVAWASSQSDTLCCILLRVLLCSIRAPFLWTAEQKWYAIELKRKSPDKKVDDIIVAIKAKYDRDVSASTLHGCLKPRNAAKTEELVNASGQNDSKHTST